MLRAILKRTFRDAASGVVSEGFSTFDFDEPVLEELLMSEGLGESSFDITQLVGIEILARVD